jgi:rhomboid protease GluP
MLQHVLFHGKYCLTIPFCHSRLSRLHHNQLRTNMEPALTKIPVRSERQAMDWSLALVSQGIESAIDHSEDGTHWGLIVANADLEMALKTLRQYRQENRHWPPWQQSLPWPEFRFDWGSVIWALVLVIFYWISSGNLAIRDAGELNIAAVSSGQWWRLFTAMQLHADLGHLASNLCIGLVLLGLAMGRYGTGLGLLGAYMAGAFGNVATFLLHSKPFHGLGASGMVTGALGLLAAQALTWRKVIYKPSRYIIAGIAAATLLFALFGLSPGTDIIAHFGGFATGLLIGSLLTLTPAYFFQNPKANLISGIAVGVLVGLTWALAFKVGN